MSLYTFVMEYKGGTYVSQVEAFSKREACIEWAKTLEVSEIHDFVQINKDRLIEVMKSENPVLLNGLVNVWCVSALLQDNLALINFVLTETTDN